MLPNSMTDILSLFNAEHSDEAALRRIIASLQDGGIYKARKALIEMEFEEMNQMSLGTNPPEDREKISQGLTEIVEKYGEEETIAMLLIHLKDKLPKDSSFDPLELLRNPRPRTPIESEYEQMLGKMYRQPSLSSVSDVIAELNLSIEVQKGTASKAEYDNLVGIESFFNTMCGDVFSGSKAVVKANKNLQQNGLIAAKEELAVAFVCLREMIKFSSEKDPALEPCAEQARFESRHRKTVARIDKIIDELGVDAVEAHLKERFGALADDLESPMLYPSQKKIECSPEMERAMIGLWGFDYEE